MIASLLIPKIQPFANAGKLMKEVYKAYFNPGCIIQWNRLSALIVLKQSPMKHDLQCARLLAFTYRKIAFEVLPGLTPRENDLIGAAGC